MVFSDSVCGHEYGHLMINNKNKNVRAFIRSKLSTQTLQLYCKSVTVPFSIQCHVHYDIL